MKNSEISAAASQVAQAVSAEHSARTALNAAQEKGDGIRLRVHNLETERVAIIARRQAGQIDVGDGSKLALLAADGEGLLGLLAEHEAIIAPLKVGHEEAVRVLQNARSLLSHVEALGSEADLAAHAAVLADKLQQTCDRLETLRVAVGRGKALWAPEPRFMDVLRRLDLAAGHR